MRSADGCRSPWSATARSSISSRRPSNSILRQTGEVICRRRVRQSTARTRSTRNDVGGSGLVKTYLPVQRHTTPRTGNRLVRGVVRWWCEPRPLHVVISSVVVEPVLTRLEARQDRMARGAGVRRCMLRWRLVATTDMAAGRAPTQVKPPPADSLTVLAAGTARNSGRIDQVAGHPSSAGLANDVHRTNASPLYSLMIGPPPTDSAPTGS